MLDIVELFGTRGHGLPNREAGKFELWYARKIIFRDASATRLDEFRIVLGGRFCGKFPTWGRSLHVPGTSAPALPLAVSAGVFYVNRSFPACFFRTNVPLSWYSSQPEPIACCRLANIQPASPHPIIGRMTSFPRISREALAFSDWSDRLLELADYQQFRRAALPTRAASCAAPCAVPSLSSMTISIDRRSPGHAERDTSLFMQEGDAADSAIEVRRQYRKVRQSSYSWNRLTQTRLAIASYMLAAISIPYRARAIDSTRPKRLNRATTARPEMGRRAA